MSGDNCKSLQGGSVTQGGILSPKTIITTHLNADFDAVASCIAAKKLYKDAHIVLPGSQQRDVRRFLNEHVGLKAEFLSLSQVSLRDCSCLVVVDTCEMERIGRFSDLIKDPLMPVEVIVYDHHNLQPISNHASSRFSQIKPDRLVYKPYGSNTAILTGILRQKGIVPSKDVATLLALGIYEDTGSFQFLSTTPYDLKEAAWLIKEGASLKEIYRYISRRFTPEHIGMLNALMENARMLSINGQMVCIVSTSWPEYVEDLSLVVHELIDMMDMEEVSALFAIVLMGDMIVIVGRSRDERIDCREILKGLGGGGHPLACSAIIRGMTLIEAEETIISVLFKSVGGKWPTVRDIMSSPVLYVYPDTPIIEAHDMLTRYGITVLPVLKEDMSVIGIISRRTIEKAIYHGLKELPVSEYMITDFKVISPDAGFGEVEEIIIGGRQRFVPVAEKGRCIGVITRTDLIEILIKDPPVKGKPLFESRRRERDISSILRERLPDRVFNLLRELGRIGDEAGMGVYVVGGFVRDLLLRRDNLDLDIVIEGDGLRFAGLLKDTYNAKITAHKKFKTAKVVFNDGFKLDIATARFEYYEYPAAMPTVSLSSLKLDLYRRDFTINTLAVRLNPKDFGMLIDFFGGQRDIKDRCIRALHSLSFVDDPTRILRAVRFEQRFGFKIGKHTLRLIKNAKKLKLFEKLSGKRILTELRLILEENEPAKAIERLNSLGLLEEIHKGILFNDRIKALFMNTKEVLSWYNLLFTDKHPKKWILMFLVLISETDSSLLDELLLRLEVGQKDASVIVTARVEATGIARWLDRRFENADVVRPSEVRRRLSPISLEAQLFSMAISKMQESKEQISRHITHYQHVKTEITGNDLLKLNIPEGPIYSEILEALKDARLDGIVKTRDDELRYINGFLRKKYCLYPSSIFPNPSLNNPK